MPTDLLDKLADQKADVDLLAESKREAHAARVQELLFDPDERDVELWTAWFLEDDLDPEFWIEIDAEELNAIPMTERDQDWTKAAVSIYALARKQATLELLAPEIIDMARTHAAEQQALASRLGAKGLERAAEIGIGKAKIEAKKEGKKNDNRIHAGSKAI